jgi:hypothetical protein
MASRQVRNPIRSVFLSNLVTLTDTHGCGRSSGDQGEPQARRQWLARDAGRIRYGGAARRRKLICTLVLREARELALFAYKPRIGESTWPCGYGLSDACPPVTLGAILVGCPSRRFLTGSLGCASLGLASCEHNSRRLIAFSSDLGRPRKLHAPHNCHTSRTGSHSNFQHGPRSRDECR